MLLFIDKNNKMILKNVINIVLLLSVLNVQTITAQIGLIESDDKQVDISILADSLYSLGNHYYFNNQDSSRIAYSKALKYYILQNNSRQQMRCLSRLSVLYDNIGNKDTALVIAYKAVSIGISNGYDTTLAEAYLRLAIMYKEIGEYEKSKEFFYKVIEKNFPNTTNGAWGGLGILYSNMQEYDSAKIYLERSMNYFKNQDTSLQIVMFNIASLYGSIGINCFDRNEPKEGLLNFEESLRISRRIGNESNIISNLLNLSIAYDMSNLPQKSEAVLKEAYYLADSIGNQKLKARVFLLMSDHYYETNDFKSAYDYLNRYHNLNDSLGRIDYKNSLHDNEIKYLQQIQEVELERMEIEKDRSKLQFILIIGGASILFILITLFLFQKVKKKTQEKKQLEKHSRSLGVSLKEATTRLAQMDQHLEEQNRLIIKLQKDTQNLDNSDVVDIVKELENQKILLNEDWGKYVETFSILHPKFLPNILDDFDNLTEGDKRQLIMIKLGYTRKKSALILGISPDSVKRAQQRLARKLNLKDITELKGFVERY
jgi:tetratricopeptide (TPR) repeat protein